MQTGWKFVWKELRDLFADQLRLILNLLTMPTLWFKISMVPSWAPRRIFQPALLPMARISKVRTGSDLFSSLWYPCRTCQPLRILILSLKYLLPPLFIPLTTRTALLPLLALCLLLLISATSIGGKTYSLNLRSEKSIFRGSLWTGPKKWEDHLLISNCLDFVDPGAQVSITKLSPHLMSYLPTFYHSSSLT